MNIDTLTRVVNGQPLIEDTFDNGQVIAWEQSGYLYAAIKTPIGWTTTASEGNRANPQVPRTTTFEVLLAMLSEDKVSTVHVMHSSVVVKGLGALCGS
jgi:hypothetical protein